jgi:hypothetical protein
MPICRNNLHLHRFEELVPSNCVVPHVDNDTPLVMYAKGLLIKTHIHQTNNAHVYIQDQRLLVGDTSQVPQKMRAYGTLFIF